MSSVLNIYEKTSKYPGGKRFFSWAVCVKAPYFGTIRPRFEELRKGYGRISMKKRRGVQNHLKSVHAIAMCNLAELVAGTTVDASLPKGFRWIPRSMTVQYLKIARTDLVAQCTVPERQWQDGENFPAQVSVRDTEGVEVFTATIEMYISAVK